MSRGITLSRDAAMAFYTGDKNGDMSLDWDEFVSIVPQLLKEEASMNELRHLFESIDIDNNKSITMDEFFIWTLTFIQQQTGSGIEAVFRRYDKNHEGSLDAREFAMAAEDMGFGDVAHELFLELDPDGSGSVTHSELEHFLKEAARYRKQGCSNNAKKFLTQLAFDSKPKTVDASGWNITATTPEELRDQLLEKAQLHDIRIADLFLIMNPSSEAGTIDRITFPAALKRVGCELSRGQMFANAVFDQLDSDGSGGFGMHDLLQWLKKIEGRLVRSRKLTLVRQPVEGMAMFALGGAQ